MNNLEKARLIINEVDKKMIELFKERMEAAKLVADYKKENNLPILDKAREEALINKNLEVLNNPELRGYYLTFFQGMLKASKDYQTDLNKKD